ncbi:MAG: DNA polymerase III subunit gamma/tau [Clostridia bacterium]|nr:DNA polymerase III subunit gamma/tau [Clostridia bacterium]
MAHVSLYRKYRPSTWDKVIGQNHIVTTLINQIKTDTVGHAYLFTGTRGTGKTSSAKIFARAVNCLTPVNGSPCGKCAACQGLANNNNVDIIEMDAASNNGVDEIRDLKESVHFQPSIGKYRVFIIDEVHMLSISAFNALLKTLEEPPKHVIFILATTEVHKLPQTILSRCMRFDFRLVSQEELVALLKNIFDEENYPYEVEALEQLAIHGQGSVRDTLSLADMCLSYSPSGLKYQDVLEVLGASDFDTLFTLAKAILESDTATVIQKTEEVYAKGKGLTTLNRELAEFFRNLITIKNIPTWKCGFTTDEHKEVLALGSEHDNYQIARVMDILATSEQNLRYTTQPRIVFEALLVKASELKTEASNEALSARVNELEKMVRKAALNGMPVAYTQSAPQPVSKAKIEAALSKFATKEKEAPVFEEAPKKAEPDERAKMVVGLLLTALREADYTMLYSALSRQSNYSLQDKVLSFNINDNATKALFENADNLAICEKALKASTDDEEYTFKLENSSSGARKVNEEQHKKLVEVFGTKYVDRNK